MYNGWGKKKNEKMQEKLLRPTDFWNIKVFCECIEMTVKIL